jgi:hypothetical protein
LLFNCLYIIHIWYTNNETNREICYLYKTEKSKCYGVYRTKKLIRSPKTKIIHQPQIFFKRIVFLPPIQIIQLLFVVNIFLSHGYRFISVIHAIKSIKNIINTFELHQNNVLSITIFNWWRICVIVCACVRVYIIVPIINILLYKCRQVSTLIYSVDFDHNIVFTN